MVEPSEDGKPPETVHGLTLYDMDVWAMRDMGFVDPELRALLAERGHEDLNLDYEREATIEQKRHALEGYEGLAEHLRSTNFDGRSDWTPREAWSMSRAAVARTHGFDANVTRFPVPWPASPDFTHDELEAMNDFKAANEAGSLSDFVAKYRDRPSESTEPLSSRMIDRLRELSVTVERQKADPNVTGITGEMLDLTQLEKDDALNPPPIWSDEYPEWHARQTHLPPLPGLEPSWTGSSRGLLPGTIVAVIACVGAWLLYAYVNTTVGVVVGILAFINVVVAARHWIRYVAIRQ